MEFIKTIILFWSRVQYNFFKILGFLFVYPISLITPRKNNLWVFGSNFGFADNPKYLFCEVRDCYPDIDAVWIYRQSSNRAFFRAKGIKAFSYYSIRGIYYTLFAKVYVYSFRTSDINFYTSGNTIKVNLWHGIALKEIEFRIKKGRNAYRYDNSIISRYRYPILYQKPDILLNVGPRYYEILRESFKVAKENCIVGIYPRCKQFMESRNSQIERIYDEGGDVQKLYERFSHYSKVYFYMPTFRDSNRNFFEEAGFDFDALNNVLMLSNSYFVIKVHPNTFDNIPPMADYSNIYIIKYQYDVYPLLPFITTMITDYSSIYFDVLLLKKEILLFPFDMNDYVKGDRELVFDYDNEIVGEKIYHFAELLDLIINRKNLYLTDDNYDNLIKKFWGNLELSVSIVDEINKRI